MSDAYLKVKDNGASGLALIREETDTSVTDLKNAINNIEKYTKVSQEYPFIVDGYINSSGGINPTTSAKNTGYISINGVKSISYKVNLSSSAYGLAFFDSSKNFLQSISIAGGTAAAESTIEITETMSQSAAYFVVSHYYDSSITWQPICSILVNDDTFDSRIMALEAESENTLKTSDISSYVGLNRFDANAVIVGKEVYGDGSLRDNANSAISDYIDVTGGQYVYLKNLPTYLSETSRLAYFYDENKNVTGTRISISRAVTEANFAIPATAKYFVFSIYQRADSAALPIDYSNVMVTTEPTEESFVPYERFISSIRDYKIPSGGGGVDVSGLKVVIFGDSITETATMNDDGTGYTEGYRHNWPEYVNNYMKWGSFKNYAKSGASYKNRGSGYEYRQTVANQIALAMADSNNDDADIVVFSLGTNDGIANIGSYETAMAKTSLADLDQTNLYEALRYAYWTVRNKYKNAVCFSAIPIQRADIEPPTQLYEAIEKMAHRYDFIVINGAWQSGIVKENNVWNASGNDLYDGLHPNTTGQLKMAKLYASVMTSHYLWNV